MQRVRVRTRVQVTRRAYGRRRQIWYASIVRIWPGDTQWQTERNELVITIALILVFIGCITLARSYERSRA